MRTAMRSMAEVLPNATYRTLARQTHMVKAGAHVPPLVEFFPAGISAVQLDAPAVTRHLSAARTGRDGLSPGMD